MCIRDSYKGSKQITFAIIATTLILVAVFLPLIFIEGIAGTLFRETAIALSFAIVVSSLVALTLSPMLASKFLNKTTKTNFFVVKFDKFFKGFLFKWLKNEKMIPSSQPKNSHNPPSN